ncbi:TPA: hypothetical protein ACH3X1_004125 [Trebouxia sp. C0004]
MSEHPWSFCWQKVNEIQDSAHQGRNSKCPAARLDNAYQASLTVRSSLNINCTLLHTAADIPRCGTRGTISMAAKPEAAPAPRDKLSSASVKPCHFRRRTL